MNPYLEKEVKKCIRCGNFYLLYMFPKTKKGNHRKQCRFCLNDLERKKHYEHEPRWRSVYDYQK